MSRKKILFALLALSVVLFFWWARYQLAIDDCLDDGGRWNYEASACEGARSASAGTLRP